MASFTKRAAALASLMLSASALDGIVTPANITADEPFSITFQNANDDRYRVYLAAALAGVNGPTCYLVNTTTLSSPLSNLSIPASVGPSASYYSIAIADLTTSQGATYSNRFHLASANGSYTAYENSLHGSPFWSPDELPCNAYSCARDCAMAGYPADLTQRKAWEEMRGCILGCDGVKGQGNVTGPALEGSAASATASSTTGGASETGSAGASETSESAAAAPRRAVAATGAAAAAFGALAFVL